MLLNASNSNESNWRNVTVNIQLPKELTKLKEIVFNLWWSWNNEAKEIFRDIDIKLWHKAGHNPVVLLNMLNTERIKELIADRVFMSHLDLVYSHFRAYMDEPINSDRPSVAYFSMEYGISNILKIYSGGLGILAGDYLKEASDSNVGMTAIGFFYRYGYFNQSLSPEGNQLAEYEIQDFYRLPVRRVKGNDGEPLVVEVPYPNRTIYAYVWSVAVGRVTLYLLDTDNELNTEWDRQITHKLYGGDVENRLKQEILLGIGGVLTLNKLGIKKDVYHCNEGHAALMGLQRLVDLVEQEHLSFNEALEVVRSSGLYTCHTPVPAGHDYFQEDLFYKYMSSYPARLGIEWSDLIGMGRQNPADNDEKFSMSVFALNTCQEANGVSKLHGIVSQKMFAPLWKGYLPEENHVGYVTNGVHMGTWTAHEWKKVYMQNFPKEWLNDLSNKEMWKNYSRLSDEVIWETHIKLKKKLIDYIRDQFKENWMKTQSDPNRIVQVMGEMNENNLIIGFGRRFATYKRAHLLFSDLNRLDKLVNNPEYPIQFLFAGKAHPADGGGQGLIKHIVEISRMPQFLGKIIFLENYDMRLAKRLISGVDIWMNTPTRPLEASGTSGQKAQMNGVLNLSVLDGWWYEGYVEGAGWALTEQRTYENQSYQDQLDAAIIYEMLETEIIPQYYKRNNKGYSPEWVQIIKNSVTQITPLFTTKRMMDDYFEKFYNPLALRHKNLIEKNYEEAKQIVKWKEYIAQNWDKIEIVEVHADNAPKVNVEEHFPIKVVLDAHDIDAQSIGIEIVTMYDDNRLIETEQVPLTKTVGSILTFQKDYTFEQAGNIKVGVRMYAKNDKLPHRMDFPYVKWL